MVKSSKTTKSGRNRYGLRARTAKGRMPTKFVSKADWDKGKKGKTFNSSSSTSRCA